MSWDYNQAMGVRHRSGWGIARRVVSVGVLSVATLMLALWIVVLLAGRRDVFEFLRGHPPFLSGVIPIIQDSGYQSKGFTDEYRVYCWREDFSQVCDRANFELARQGYIRQRTRYQPD